MAQRCPLVADVRGIGAMQAMELCYESDPWRPAADVANRVMLGCLERGVLIVLGSPYSNVLRVLAPLVISDEDLDRALDVLEESLLEAADQAPAA